MVLRGQSENPAPTLKRALAAFGSIKLTKATTPERPPRALIVQHRLTKDQIVELVGRYQAGASTYALAKQFKVHRTTVSGHLRAHGIAMRGEATLPEDRADRVVELYADGWSLARAGKEVGCDAETVRKVLKQRGIARRSPHERPPRA